MSVFTSPGRAEQGREQGRAVAGQNVGEPQPAGAHVREIVIEPGRERCVDVADVAIGIDREEARRRVIEIVDGVLQFLEDVFLALAIAGHVGDGPHRSAFESRCVAQRAYPQAQPPCRLSARPGDPHFLLEAPAIAARLEQPVDRL